MSVLVIEIVFIILFFGVLVFLLTKKSRYLEYLKSRFDGVKSENGFDLDREENRIDEYEMLGIMGSIGFIMIAIELTLGAVHGFDVSIGITILILAFAIFGLFLYCHFRYKKVFGHESIHLSLDEYKQFFSPKKLRRHRIILGISLVLLIGCLIWPWMLNFILL